MKLYQQLEDQLKQENDFITDEGELKKWVVINMAQNFDEKLITLLLEDAELKETFFLSVKDALIFNQNKFIQFLEQKNYLNDSYTQYRNKVGLNIDGKFLKQRNEVSLVWPFKDCVLEGGQSREEDKREEIFFNEILAQDEITQLLEPKVLTNAKTYDKDGEQDFTGFNRNAEINKKRGLPEDTITDNLIIKGNNLLALHSLKKEFAGKVKLIYIDPPYNTGSDSFSYNDSFNHSTWLTFMKNRLSVAKELLREDGMIFVHIDYIEQAYLKVLMDEIFSSKGFIQMISIKTSTASGVKVVNPGPVNVTEFVLVYAKDRNKVNHKRIRLKSNYQKDYSKYICNIDEHYSKWEIKSVKEKCLEDNNIDESEIKKKYGNKVAIKIIDDLLEKFSIENAKSIFATFGANKPAESLKLMIKKSKANPTKIFSVAREGKKNHYLLNGRLLAFYSSKIYEVDGKPVPTKILTDFWSDLSWDSVSLEGKVKFPNGKKPEKFIRRILELASEENDIVLDYHLGSGTTSAVAHKLGRQYIGVEQLDYGDNDSTTRLVNVIDGDPTGISKLIDWKGGGSFKYFELKKYNQTFINQIEQAKATKELVAIWEQMKEKSFLNYNVDIKKQDAHIDDFKTLNLKQQKEHLVSILEKNQLYVNLSSLNDVEMECTVEDKKVTQDFYQINKA